MIQQPQDARSDGFAWTLLLLAPSFVALIASAGFARAYVSPSGPIPTAWPSISGLWFLYDISYLMGFGGIIVTSGVILGLALRRACSVFLLIVMLLAVGGALLSLCYAASIVHRFS